MPAEDRAGITHTVTIGGMKGYIVANPDPEGDGVYEVFVKGFGQMGSVVQGWSDSFAIMLSIGLQNGMKLEDFAPILCQMKFEPYGETDNKEIPTCFSIPDYIAQWLVLKYGDEDLQSKIATIRGAS